MARVGSAKQDYAAALAKVRESDAANFKAQRDALAFFIRCFAIGKAGGAAD
jgi:hypothetical protein